MNIEDFDNLSKYEKRKQLEDAIDSLSIIAFKELKKWGITPFIEGFPKMLY